MTTPPTSPESPTTKVPRSAFMCLKQSRDLMEVDEDETKSQEALRQTVAFTEKLASVKVFLETQYSGPDFNEITPRSLRRRRMEFSLYLQGKSQLERESARKRFQREESNFLRQTRLAKAHRLQDHRKMVAVGYQPLRILGKGSFGLVRLVRDLSDPETDFNAATIGVAPVRNEVYAMKVIRKEEMLRSCQEAHLRAERDFLADAAGTSKWVVPLRASFQDHDNLYLVMDYAIGGDFLGLLLREEVISERYAQFYLAEMICCIEEAHNMGWIHRDIKPDNFLITSTGHLKISDFGLAFDGEWAHTQSYYYHRRYCLLEELGIHVKGDRDDEEQDKRKIERLTDQGMSYDGARSRAMQRPELSRSRDPRSVRRMLANSVWSIGIILFECLYGFTPFCKDNRDDTKRAIVDHENKFSWPNPPPQEVTYYARDLIYRLLQEPWSRLSSCAYGYQPPARQFVYQNDAQEIKDHPFFSGVPWTILHKVAPPWVPRVRSADSTKYFDSEEEILGSEAVGINGGSVPLKQAPELDGQHQEHKLQGKPMRRPRDRLLRDPITAETVMEARKKTAFLGYTYRRARNWNTVDELK
ncbi:MAG: hypothetical protein Q9162_004786 [Coniocarpon cinnabarinum]